MAERKSKPRKQEPVDDEARPPNRWFLGMWIFGAVGVIFLMYLVSQFLANKPIESWFYFAFGAITLVTAAFWFGGWLAERRAAA